MQNYTDIEQRISEAKALRDQAIGRMFTAAGVALRGRFAAGRAALARLLAGRKDHLQGLTAELNPYRSISRKSLSTIFP